MFSGAEFLTLSLHVFTEKYNFFMRNFLFIFCFIIGRDMVLCETYVFLRYRVTYCFFVFSESSISTFELEKYYFSEPSLWETIEDEIVTSLSEKYHIFWFEWEIRQCWKYFFVELTEYLIFWSSESRFPDFFVFKGEEYPHNRHSDDESKSKSDNKCRNIHMRFWHLEFSLYYPTHTKNQIMLKVIATESRLCIDTIISLYSPERLESNHMVDAFRKGKTVYLFLKKPPSLEMVTWIASEYLPERLYFFYLGYSIDMIHEVWDVIVANVFLKYSPNLENVEITKENRDSFIEEKVFIENFHEQKDYYVEDFWLSLWGILVSGAKENPSNEYHEKLMLAYEADIYVAENVFSAIDVLSSDEVPTLILAWAISGKPHSKYEHITPVEFTIKNLTTTIQLLEADAWENDWEFKMENV